MDPRPLQASVADAYAHGARRSVGWLALSVVLLALGGCADISWPFHRESSDVAALPGASPDDTTAACQNIRADIRSAEQDRRQAPTTTTYSDIVDAAQAKDDQRIDELRQRAANLDCPDEPSERPVRRPPIQPAPGGAGP